MMKPLDDVRVLDLSGFIAGAYGTGMLASFGAEVIMIEPVTGSFMRSVAQLDPGLKRLPSLVNHDKKSLALNLKTEEGKDIFKALVGKSDVLVETYMPGVMARLGLDYPALRDINPGLVYLSQTAYGQTGPRSQDVGYDAGVQATSGMQTLRERPEVAPPVFADIVSSVYGAIGILFALWHKRKSGRGQYIDLSNNDAMFSQNYLSFLRIVWEGLPDIMIKMSCHPPRCLLGCFKAKDGYVATSILQQEQWVAASRAMGEPRLLEDERFANILNRAMNDEAAVAIIEDWTTRHTRDEVVEAMNRTGTPCAKVLTVEEVAEDPQLRFRGMFTEVRDDNIGAIKIPAVPFKMSDIAPELRRAAPRLGEHTEELMTSLLGYSRTQVAEMKGQGVIA